MPPTNGRGRPFELLPLLSDPRERRGAGLQPRQGRGGGEGMLLPEVQAVLAVGACRSVGSRDRYVPV